MRQLLSDETSYMQGMKKTLHSLAALVCLLTLLLSATTCLHAKPPAQPSCSHCPEHAPTSPTVPSCCAAPHQSPAVIPTAIEHQTQLTLTLICLPADEIASSYLPPVTQLTT